MSQTTKNARKTASSAADTAKAATDDGQAAMNDGVERMTAGMSQLGSFGQDAMEAMIAAATTFTKGMERVAQDNAAFAKSQMEASQSRMQTLTKVRSPQDYFETTSEMMREAMEAGIGQASKVSDMMIETTRESAQPISKRYTAMVEQMQAR